MSTHTWGLGDPPLPGRPDADTGLPRPPSAPRWSLAGTIERGSLHLGADGTDLSAVEGLLPPPPERSRPLEVYRARRYDGLYFVALGAAILGFTALLDVRVLGFWWLWVVFAVVAALGARSVSRTYLAAGADYLQTRRTWVDVYALREITVGVGTGQHWITFLDDQDRRTTAPTNELHANPALWDLVYNGIRHSVAGGARVKGSGARHLRPPARGERPPPAAR
ncbi:hypothetical protein [Actinomycetospora sp. NBRC 106378]|uniref:NfeD family protein n=1 Tax=Actinomycetospora sp. NBRC 106378 TaxID=3032208 RepID=UPI00249F9F3D|nr:hypothetical protein [Actinomycetospora sp. NBRC 106378]GLZ56029.1 hypothetical protein Acsp07_56460 [Actinomycetospora sp. NBRC 106378]